jgi:hypothetical protein
MYDDHANQSVGQCISPLPAPTHAAIGPLLSPAVAHSTVLPTRQSGRSSGVEHNLAKVGVEGSNPFARSSFYKQYQYLTAQAEIDFFITRLKFGPA